MVCSMSYTHGTDSIALGANFQEDEGKARGNI